MRTCSYCPTVLKAHGAHEKVGDVRTVDHLIPLSRGGTNAKWNKVACCKKCNALRQNFMSVKEYLHMRAEHGYRSGRGDGATRRHNRTMEILRVVEGLVPAAMEKRGGRPLRPLCEHQKDPAP